MTTLERHYLRWIAVFYPADYRRERASELAGTYLAGAASDRRRPSAADIGDLAAGGLRQHLRLARGLNAGVRLAGLLALMTASALATFWAMVEVLVSSPPWRTPVGPFLSIGAAVWGAWLLAAVVFAAAPGRWFRWATGFAVLVTVAIIPVATLTGMSRPPLVVLLPQLVLGIVALGAAEPRTRWLRLLPVVAAVASVPIAVQAVDSTEMYGDYYWLTGVLPAAAVTLLIGATVLALALAFARDFRGAWALLILLTPIGMLAVNTLGAVLDNAGPGVPVVPAWPSMAIASALVTVLGPALLPLALTVRGRLAAQPRPHDEPTGCCPTCGTPSATA